MSEKISILDEQQIDYQVIRDKRKRLTISYNAYNVLEIKAPLRMPPEKIDLFINAHIDWILKHKRNKYTPHLEYQTGSKYVILGTTYPMSICQNKHEAVELANNTLYVYTNSLSNVEKLLDQYRMELSQFVFNEILSMAFLKFKNYLKAYPNLTIKKSKSRWGCCYYKENRIMLNLTLVHVSKDLIEYVIYHELCHFVCPNHSKDFHLLLQEFVPNEKECRKKLSNYSVIYK